jgi:hypothetical protein
VREEERVEGVIGGEEDGRPELDDEVWSFIGARKGLGVGSEADNLEGMYFQCP